jgi:hypothetical protein
MHLGWAVVLLAGWHYPTAVLRYIVTHTVLLISSRKYHIYRNKINVEVVMQVRVWGS